MADFITDIIQFGIADHIRDKISYYHASFITPINGPLFEEIFDYGLTKIGLVSNWRSGSHEPGKDISVAGIGLSLKGTKYVKKHMKISGCRTTRKDTIAEKLKELEKVTSNHQYVIVCERVMPGRKDAANQRPERYDIYSIDSDYLSVGKFEWVSSYYKSGMKQGQPSGYRTLDNGTGIDMSIRGAMSDQLWISIPRNNQINVKLLVSIKL